MSKITVDDGKEYLQLIIVDGETRTTISVPHKDGLEMLAQLQAYYGDGEMKQDVIKAAALAMLDSIVNTAAEKKLVELLSGGADGPTDKGQQGDGGKAGD